jgi:hypothetical protein
MIESGELPMTSSDAPTPTPQPNPAENIAAANELLKSLREKLGQHPELEEAIVKLEMALSALTLQTGGLL